MALDPTTIAISAAVSLVSGGAMGGVVNVYFTGRRARAAADSAFRAAVLLVSDELQVNINHLQIAVDGPEIPADLESRTYQDVQVQLAERLDPKAMRRLRQAYLSIRSPRVFERTGYMLGQPATGPVTEHIAAALEYANRAKEALAPYIPQGDAVAG